MAQDIDCKHEDFGYFPAVNEQGWKCNACREPLPGEPDGYRPDLDRSHLELKVFGMINDLHQGEFIYVSNGEYGEFLTGMVMKECQRAGLYDQISIMQYILALNSPEYAAYWKGIGEGIVAGKIRETSGSNLFRAEACAEK